MREKDTKYCNCLYYSSNVLARVLTKMADDAFKSVGLAPSYAFLLMTVNNRPGIQPSELSKELQLSPSTVTRLVEKMEHQGYLKRVSEGRATRVEPTDKSRELDSEIRNAWQSLSERYAEVLGERYSEVLTEMTFKATQKLGD